MDKLEKLKQQMKEERSKEKAEDTPDSSVKRFVHEHHELMVLLAMHDKR
ncbi:hypothetical protein [Weissella confusa]|nr:hypothetical protein [Weissella confusa]